jgi:site-specific recombinase XerD
MLEMKIKLNPKTEKIEKYGVYEYRPGHFQVYFSEENKLIRLQKSMDGSPLTTQEQCYTLVAYLKVNGYHPDKFGKDKTFRMEQALTTWIKLSDISPEWREQRRGIANRFFLPFFGKDKDIRQVKSIHIQEFLLSLKERGLKDKSIYNAVGELRAFFRFHKKSIPELPDFPVIRVQEPVIKWIDGDIQDRIWKCIPDQDLPIFEFMRNYGCRENEASGLLWDNVFTDHNPPYIILSSVLGGKGQLKPITKTKKIKVLPIIDKTAWLFQNNQNRNQFVFTRGGRPYSKKMLNRIWNKAIILSGEEKINLYNAVRHSFACQRLNQGYSLDEIREVLGHTDSRTTERYAKYRIDRLSKVIRGKVVEHLLMVNQPLQIPEKISGNKLGDEESNLDSRSQSPVSYH